VAVQKNISDLSSVITVSPEMKSILTGLFLTKFRMLSSNPSAENKKYVSEIIERKLEATLDGPSFKKIRENETLFKSLVN
jgi:hypothetical protein